MALLNNIRLQNIVEMFIMSKYLLNETGIATVDIVCSFLPCFQK
ncbi:MAG: hypothetical protein JWR61_4223 [Ferruginibacter sp.]|nr:hypothetical protein [Ferruginibacter sp.]